MPTTPRITEHDADLISRFAGGVHRGPILGTASRRIRDVQARRSATAAPAVAQIPWSATSLRPRAVNSRALPSSPSRINARLTWRCSWCSAVKPIPAEHLLAVPCRGQRRLAGRRFGQQAGQIIRIVGCRGGGLQGRLGALDRDECLGQSVPDRLKRADVAAELNSVQRMLARQCKHCAAGADQPPAQCPPPGGKPGLRQRISFCHTMYRQLAVER